MASPPEIEKAPSVLYNSAISGKTPMYEEESVDSQTETEDECDKWFRERWPEFSKSLSEFTFGEGRYGLGRGTKLLEIFEIRIKSNQNTKTHKLNINGSVTVKSGLGVSNIFRRSPQNPQVIINSEDNLTMMGPHMGMAAEDFSRIKVDIKDGGRQLCKGSMEYSFFGFRYDMMDRPLVHMLQTKHVKCQITYAIFYGAMLINAEIKLLPSSNNFHFPQKNYPMKIFGTINASIKGVKFFDSVKTALFRRTKANGVIVGAKGGLIPLSKSLMALPLDWTLELSVDLEEHFLFDSGNCNSFVKEVVQCTPKQFGDHKHTIQSKYGPIEVNLTAYPTYMHPNTQAAFKKRLYY